MQIVQNKNNDYLKLLERDHKTTNCPLSMKRLRIVLIDTKKSVSTKLLFFELQRKTEKASILKTELPCTLPYCTLSVVILFFTDFKNNLFKTLRVTDFQFVNGRN